MVGALLGHNLGHQPILRPNSSEESAHGSMTFSINFNKIEYI